MSESLAIETVDLRKRFDATEALRGLNLRVPQGSIFGFLGRNGAGKTTTIKLLLGMARPTAGQARVLGLAADDAAASVTIRTRTGFVDENKALYDYMTVEEIIRFTAAFYPGWRHDLEKRYLRSFGLPLHQKTNALSLGMRSKLSLLLALCRGVELLVLDEPTSGLDPAASEEVLQAIVTHVSTENADRVLLDAPSRRRRSDCRSHRHHRRRTHDRVRAHSTICADSIAACSSCSTARLPTSRFTHLASSASAGKGAS